MNLEFLSPGWLAAAPLFLGALTLLYFLKLKRRDVTVASTFLWKQSLDDLRVNAPFQRLRMNLLLILQLLALSLLLLALARPMSNLADLGGADAILLIDVSASMQTADTDDPPNRFERARELARGVVEGLSFGDRAMLIAFADDARVLTDLTDSKALLLRTLDALQVTDRPTSLRDGLERVRALVQGSDRTPQVYVFSDGQVGDLAGVALSDAVPLHFVRIGEATDNVGIVGLDVHGGADVDAAPRVFASVAAEGAAATVGVDLYLDDELAASREVKLAAGGVASVPFELPYGAADEGERRLRVELDPKDVMPADDVVHALLRPPAPTRVLLVTGGNVFLHSALSEDPQIQKTARGDVPLLPPEAFDPSDPALLEYDVIVLDRLSAESLPPGNYLCFGAAPPFEGFGDLGQIEGTEILDWDETQPVARFVNFATLIAPTARRLGVRTQDTVIVRSTLGPLVVDARDGDRRAIVCAFDLMALPVEGAWTFDPSFPIFLSNAIRALGGGGRGDSRAALARTAEEAELRYPPGAVAGRVEPPEGDPFRIPVLPGDDVLRVPRLDRAGIYEVTFELRDGAEGPTTRFAANLLDEGEVAIAPTEVLQVAGRGAPAVDEAVEAPRELWKALALIALAVVMLEWWVYNRRVFV